MTSRSEVHHANHYTIEASYKKGQIFYVEVYNVLLFCEVKIKMHVTYNEWILVHTRMLPQKNIILIADKIIFYVFAHIHIILRCPCPCSIPVVFYVFVTCRRSRAVVS